MLIFGNVQEKCDSIGTFFAAHIAREDIVIAVVTHVDGVENGILKRNAAEFAIECFGGCICTVCVGCVIGMVFVVVYRRLASSIRFDWRRGGIVDLLLMIVTGRKSISERTVGVRIVSSDLNVIQHVVGCGRNALQYVIGCGLRHIMWLCVA